MKKEHSRRMKRIAWFLFFLAIIFSPIIAWYVHPSRELQITVVDKTVGEGYREHRSFFWILSHLKITDRQTKNFYDYSTDYYGFNPDDSTYSDDKDFDLRTTDMLYITDTYGVYRFPFEVERYEKIIPKSVVPLKFMYGGISEIEAKEMKRYDSLGRTSIAEFNVLGYPTYNNRKVKHTIEQIYKVHYNGLLGKFYDRLEDVSRSVKDIYEAHSKKNWTYTGRGIVIIDEGLYGGDSAKSVTVLENHDLQFTALVLRNEHHPLMDDVDDNIPYFYFFEILQMDSCAKVLVNYEIQCTESGKQKLQANGLPIRFPAVVASDSTYRNFYFAGDYADNEVVTFLTRVWNIEYVIKRLYYFYIVSDQTRFYWRFYMPLMKNIIDSRVNISSSHSPRR